MPTRETRTKEEFYANGTIKVKNADDVLVPFYPKTKTDCIYDYQTSQSLSTVISQMEEDIETAASSGGVKVTYDSDGVESYASEQANESLVVAIEPAVWKYTINTSYISEYNEERHKRVSSFPIDYDGIKQGSLDVSWGDGTTSAISSSNLTESDDSDALHQYSADGIYHISLSAVDSSWKQMFLTSTIMPFQNLSMITQGNSINANLRLFKATLVSVDSALPKVCGMYGFTEVGEYQGSIAYTKRKIRNSLCGLFFQCQNLARIPEDIFAENDTITNFSYCFERCTSLNDFTIHITSPNVDNAERFVNYKSGAERIVYVPSGSTTQATFNLVASNLGLTIIGE